MEVVRASVRVSIQPSSLIPGINSKLLPRYLASNATSFPHKACSLSASMKDNPRVHVVGGMKTKAIDQVSEFDRLFEERISVFRYFMSDYGLTRSNVLVRIEWLIKLSQIPEVTVIPILSDEILSFLEGVMDEFGKSDYKLVKRLERCSPDKNTGVEAFLMGNYCRYDELDKVYPFLSSAFTNEDNKNLAYTYSLKEAINRVVLPVMDDLIRAFCTMAKDYAHIPIEVKPAAVTTTLGKEIANFAARLSNERHRLSKVVIASNFACYSGNLAYPELDWQILTKEFVEETFGLSFNPCVTRSHDHMVDLIYAMKRFSVILAKFFQHVQAYTSLGIFNQTTTEALSTLNEMNLLDEITEVAEFEGSAGPMLFKLVTKDGETGWSSSTLFKDPVQQTNRLIMEKMSERLMCHLLSYKVALRAIQELQVNETHVNEDLNNRWELLLDPIEMVMRIYADHVAEMEKMRASAGGENITYAEFRAAKEAVYAGGQVTKDSLAKFILGLEMPWEAKDKLLKLTPHNYIGLTANLAHNVDQILEDLGRAGASQNQ